MERDLLKKRGCRAYVPGTGLLALFLGVCRYCGDMVMHNSTAQTTEVIALQVVFTAVCAFVLLNLAAKYLFSASVPDERAGGFRGFFGRHAFILTFIALLIVWVPHLIYQYPAGICNDVYCQIQAVLNGSQLTGHHPILHTELLRFFLYIGSLLGKYDKGLFLFAIVQHIVVALVFSYVIAFLVRQKVSGGFIGAAMLFFGFSFFTAGNVSNLTKDTLYSAFLVLLFVLFAEYLLDKENFFSSAKHAVLLILSSTLAFLLRKNGKFIVLPLLLIILICELKRRADKKLYRVGIVAMAAIVPFASQAVINAIVQPTGASIREALSIPFQQTALLVQKAPELITEEEKEIINQILPYDELPDLYCSYISDPVKKRYNDNATKEQLFNYLKVWFKQFFRAPLIYIEATYAQNVYLFYTGYNDYSNELFLEDNGGRSAPLTENDYELIAPAWKTARAEEYRSFWQKVCKSPVLGWMSNVAVAVILFLLMLLLILKYRDGLSFLLSIPLILCLLVVIAAPCIRNNSRYIYPLIWSWPVWIGFFRIRRRLPIQQ